MKKAIENNARVISIIAAMLAGYAIGLLSIYYLEEYGWTVFVLVPFFLGLIPGLIYGRVNGISRVESMKMGFMALGIFFVSTLLFGLEGLICLIMALPIMAISTWIGSLLGYWLVENWIEKGKQAYSLFLLPILFMSIDVSVPTKEQLKVTTTIEINAPIDEVWHNVISFGQIEEPEEWIFKTGIAYPVSAEIKGKGVGAVRYCNFTTGSFVEPITVWQAPHLLKFDVIDQPIPMNELNPFREIHPPHLDGYFQSKKGEFKLTELENGMVRLEGTTWYNIHIHPVAYWDVWAKFILHKIHFRVLKHIKKESEQ